MPKLPLFAETTRLRTTFVESAISTPLELFPTDRNRPNENALPFLTRTPMFAPRTDTLESDTPWAFSNWIATAPALVLARSNTVRRPSRSLVLPMMVI
ncbi:MAG: hypothetical protein BWY59_00975 [Verrucomicrobia bacterium ADurb.Bin345]|nr:MAG: hypothetical protein BWY59_00975 [Verrucomicrobia bacterium ADurb.Bin345]